MTQSFSTLRLHWLTQECEQDFAALGSSGDIEEQPLAIPPELGRGTFSLLQLPYGGSFFWGRNQLLPAANGALIPVGEIKLDYGQPSFLVHTVRGGRSCHQEFLPKATLLFEEGRDLFCHMRERHVVPMAECPSQMTMVAFCLHLTSLSALIGDTALSVMLDDLGISKLQSYSVRAMPKRISAILHLAITKPLMGATRKLFLQAKAMEYLSALSDHLQGPKGSELPEMRERDRVRALHSFLLQLEGKLPCLEDLARQFGCPARRLNAGFIEEYGESIFSCLSGHRLNQARAVLIASDIPMKVLADRLGYSHVNHFITAFKRRFGHTPGNLRRRTTPRDNPQS
jgi:AraC-like DNA-binding protein